VINGLSILTPRVALNLGYQEEDAPDLTYYVTTDEAICNHGYGDKSWDPKSSKADLSSIEERERTVSHFLGGQLYMIGSSPGANIQDDANQLHKSRHVYSDSGSKSNF
jgi:hypothetical protein